MLLSIQHSSTFCIMYMLRFALLVLLTACLMPGVVRAQDNVVINEFLASNNSSTGLRDEDNELNDWIEIYNAGTNTVNLQDWALTDAAGTPFKWRFPATNINAGAYIVVFASEKNRRVPGARLHTNFRLGTGGEYLALVRPDGTRASEFSPQYPPQVSNVSYGRGSLSTNDTVVKSNSTLRVHIPTAGTPANWATLGFDASSWIAGTNGVGFGPANAVEPNYGAAVAPTLPVGHWRLNEAAGTTATNTGSGANLNGTYNATALGTAGPRSPTFGGFEANNNAPTFNGSSSYVNVPNSIMNNRGAFTVAGWIKPTVTPGNRIGLFGQNDCIEFGFIAGTTLQCWTPGGGSVNATYTPAMNTWHHVAAVGDGTTIKVYVDGTEIASGGTPTASYGSSAEPFRIGGGGIFDVQSVNGNYFNGQIDEVLAYHRALSVSEVQSLYQAGLTPTDASVTPFVTTHVGSLMSNVNASAYLRIPFVVPNASNITLLTLRARYDDGFVAYINGTLALSANAPSTLAYNSAATNTHSPLAMEEFRLGSDNLVSGTNILAIHALNRTADDSDFLMAAELATTTLAGESPNPVYFTVPSPGVNNGSGVAIPGPAILEPQHSPNVPLDTQDLLITAQVAPTFQPIASVVMRYRVMFGPEIETQMFDDGIHGDGASNDMVYAATIPNSAYTNGQMVRWYFRATDTAGASSRWPLFTNPSASAEYLGTMVEMNVTSKLPVVYLFAPANILQPGPDASPQIGADSQAGARVSLFHLGEFYDNIHMELRGNSTAGFRKKSHRLNFNREHLFKHTGPGPRIRETSFVADYPDPTYMRQGLAFWLAEKMGAPGPFYEPVRLQLNGQFYQLANHSDIHDVEILNRLGYDSRGALYNAAGTVVPGQFSTGGFEKKTRTQEGNADYTALANAIAETVAPGQRRTNVFEVFDLPQALNYLVTARWVHENDDVWANMSLYHDNDGDNLWRIIPFDMNLSWGAIFYEGGTPSVIEGVQATNDIHKAHPLYGSSQATALSGPGAPNNFNRVYDSFFLIPQTREMFLRRMRTLMDTMIGPPGTPPGTSPAERRILELRDLMDEEAARDRAWWGWPAKGGQANFDPGIAFIPGVNAMITNFIGARRNHFYVKHSVANTALAIGVTKDSNAGIPLDQPGDAVIRIHSLEYNPSSGNQEQEFICLTNPLPYAVDISGWELSGGVQFTFKPGTVMGTNSVLYVSPNVVAFRARTTNPRGGQGHFVVGKYDGQLSARGETVLLHDQWGRLVNTNSYPGNPSAAQNYLRITEIMYAPAAPSSGPYTKEDFEYIELKNVGPTTLDLRGVRLAEGVVFNFTGSAATNLLAGERVLVVRNLNAFISRYGAGLKVAGQFIGSLENNGERIQLLDSVNEEILDFDYENDWYPITDGFGFSLVVADENQEPDLWDSKAGWRASGQLHGAPGAIDPPAPVFVPVRINEVLTHTDPPLLDTIELHNPSTNIANIGGWFLTDDFMTPKKYRITNGTTIAPGGYITFNENQFNPTPGAGTSFSLSSQGDEVFLFSGDAQTNLTGYVHGHDFGAVENGVSLGIHYISTGDEHLVRQVSRSLGAVNEGPKIGPIIISEIMYRPADDGGEDNSLDEYIELQNIGVTTLLYDLGAPTNTWKLEKGVDFNFPTNIAMPGGSFLLIVNFDPSNTTLSNAFRARFNVPGSVPILGPYEGKLDNSGERIELRMPDVPETNEVPYVLIERVDYADSAPWPAAADGSGASLQRVPTSSYYNDPASWRAAAPTAGRAYGGAGGTAPQITAQPVSQNVVSTTDATLSVTATGTAPLFYQWRHNGGIIPGATNSTLLLDNVQPSDRGDYDVLVFNSVGSTVSSNALINVLIAARILQQPASILFNRGSTNSATWGYTFTNFTFTVQATSSSPLAYQWQFNGINIPGATSSVLVISNATLANAGTYSAVVTDAVGSIQSDIATLTINIPPIIYQHPSPVIAVAGDTVNFIVNAGGTAPFSYRWRRNGVNLFPGAGTIPFPYYSITNVATNNAGNYQVIVTNPGNPAPGIASVNAALTVLADADGDHVPDVFESANGFNPADPADGAADTDGDTMTNAEEYTAGTDPRDAQSYLKIDQISAAGGANVTFLARSNKTYTIQFRDDLSGSIWQRLTNVTSRTTNQVHTVVDPTAMPDRFYRLVTPYQP
jgi:hypothetical protein